jgi:hypothetical protein
MPIISSSLAASINPHLTETWPAARRSVGGGGVGDRDDDDDHDHDDDDDDDDDDDEPPTPSPLLDTTS